MSAGQGSEYPHAPGQFFYPPNYWPPRAYTGVYGSTKTSKTARNAVKAYKSVETPEQTQTNMKKSRDKYIAELEQNYDNITTMISNPNQRLQAQNAFVEDLPSIREGYERNITDATEREEALAKFDAAVEKIKAKRRGGRKSRKIRSKKSRKTRRLVRK